MPLFGGLVAPEDKQVVLSNLVKDIEESSGSLPRCNRYLFQVLAKRLNDVMYMMHNHNEVPGMVFNFNMGHLRLPNFGIEKGARGIIYDGQIEVGFTVVSWNCADSDAYTGFKIQYCTSGCW